MAAATDKLKKYKSLFSTTLSTGIGTGTSDTLTPASVSGLPTDTAITITIDRVDSDGNSLGNQVERIVGVVSGGNIINYVRGIDGTTEQAHAGGAVVEMVWNADDWNDMVDWALVGHNQDGSHGASSIVASNMAASSITAGRISASAVTSGTLAASAVVAGNLAASAVTSGNISASAVTLGNMSASSVGTGNLNFTPVTATGSETLTNKTVGDTLLMTTGAITQSGTAAHITLTPGTSKLVRFTYLKQSDTTDAYKDNSVILAGWGFKNGNGVGAAFMAETVTFGITFTEAPIVVASGAGRSVAGSGSTEGLGATWNEQVVCTPSAVGTTSFSANLIQTNNTNFGNFDYIYSWIAIGVL